MGRVTGSLKSVNRIWAVPKTDKILAGVNGSGLLAYTAAGKTWTQLAGTKGTTVSQVVFDPCNGDRFWIAAQGAGGGVLLHRRWRRDRQEARHHERRHRSQRRLQGHHGPDDHRRQDDAFAMGRRSGCGLGFHRRRHHMDRSEPQPSPRRRPHLSATSTRSTTRRCSPARSRMERPRTTMRRAASGSRKTAAPLGRKGRGWTVRTAPATPGAVTRSGTSPGAKRSSSTKTNSIWWINFWQNTVFTSSDNGSTWIDQWGCWDHSAVGGGVPTAIPKKQLPKPTPPLSDPMMITIKALQLARQPVPRRSETNRPPISPARQERQRHGLVGKLHRQPGRVRHTQATPTSLRSTRWPTRSSCRPRRAPASSYGCTRSSDS